MKLDVIKLAKEAGFRVFNNKIVAADRGSSGLATDSLERFAVLVIEECAKVCDCYTIDDDKKNDDARRCAKAIRAMKEPE